jgi:hypothetical protein
MAARRLNMRAMKERRVSNRRKHSSGVSGLGLVMSVTGVRDYGSPTFSSALAGANAPSGMSKSSELKVERWLRTVRKDSEESEHEQEEE